jgi:hypothetical protein
MSLAIASNILEWIDLFGIAAAQRRLKLIITSICRMA